MNFNCLRSVNTEPSAESSAKQDIAQCARLIVRHVNRHIIRNVIRNGTRHSSMPNTLRLNAVPAPLTTRFEQRLLRSYAVS
jgi:hypothetical protein